MSTDKELLGKGIKKIALLLVLLILSPLVVSFGFKGLTVFADSNKIFIAYALLFIGFFLVIFTVFQGFKAFKTILDALFNKNK